MSIIFKILINLFSFVFLLSCQSKQHNSTANTNPEQETQDRQPAWVDESFMNRLNCPSTNQMKTLRQTQLRCVACGYEDFLRKSRIIKNKNSSFNQSGIDFAPSEKWLGLLSLGVMHFPQTRNANPVANENDRRWLQRQVIRQVQAHGFCNANQNMALHTFNVKDGTELLNLINRPTDKVTSQRLRQSLPIFGLQSSDSNMSLLNYLFANNETMPLFDLQQKFQKNLNWPAQQSDLKLLATEGSWFEKKQPTTSAQWLNQCAQDLNDKQLQSGYYQPYRTGVTDDKGRNLNLMLCESMANACGLSIEETCNRQVSSQAPNNTNNNLNKGSTDPLNNNPLNNNPIR